MSSTAGPALCPHCRQGPSRAAAFCSCLLTQPSKRRTGSGCLERWLGAVWGWPPWGSVHQARQQCGWTGIGCDVNNHHPLVECLGCPEFLLLQMTLCTWISSFVSFTVRPEVAGGGVPV